MTKKESLEWMKSLKPGDTVIYKDLNRRIISATVEKVTPSGIVRTNRGSFKESTWSWSGNIGGYGKTVGEIIPLTEELLAEAVRQRAEEAVMQKKRDTIRKAQNIIFELYNNRFKLDYAEAVKVIRALEGIEQTKEGGQHERD